MSIELVMPSSHLILCRPLLLLSAFLSIRVFSNESALHIRWPKDWSFSFNISLSNEHSWTDWISLQSKGLSRVFSNTTVQVQQFFSAQSCLTLQPHGLQNTRLPCPSPAPKAYSNSCPSSRWCHPTISSSVVPFSSRLHSFPASGSFPMSQLFASVGQSIAVSASASVLPKNTQD